MEEKNREKEILSQNLSLASQKAEEENARLVAEKGKTGEKRKMQHTITFEGKQHDRVKNMRPFIKQIVSDMHDHAKATNPATAGH